jgi:DNA-binding NarL/FixJ family response regulator
MKAVGGKDRKRLLLIDDDPNHMIICDIMMPEMDGYALIENVRQDQRTSWIPVLFLSARGQSQDRIKGLNLGADVYMVKPFEPEELVAQVESSLKQTNRLLLYTDGIGDDSSPIQVPATVELTPTELKVVQLVARGLANREIALQMNVSQRTIESHVSNMLGKTGLNNRTELARWAIETRMA